MAQILKGTTYTSGGTVTDANLNNLVDNATLLAGAITEQNSVSSLASGNQFLVDQSGLKRITAANLFASPQPIGSTTPSTVAATTLTASGLATVGTLTSTGLATAGSLSVGGTSAHTGAATFASTATFNGVVSGVIPAGTVVCRASANVPTGWLACNGQVVIRATYADLFADIGVAFGAGDGSTTFGLPDLRGEFVRGADAGRGIDSGRVLGSAQSDEFESHRHAWTGTTFAGGDGGDGYITVGSDITPPTQSGAGSLMDLTGSTETRPRNIALSYIIKT